MKLKIVFAAILCTYLPMSAGRKTKKIEYKTSASTPRHENLITNIQVTKHRIDITLHESFKSRFLKDHFFAEYDTDIDLTLLDPSILVMPCIMQLITAVWISGETYAVESLDEELSHSLENLKTVFKIMYPKTSWNGNLIPKKLVRNELSHPLDASHTALLFSGGVDCTSSSLYHKNDKQLLITAWGQWDLPLNDTQLWSTVKERIVKFAQLHGHKNSFLRSNYAEFLNYDYLESLSPEIPLWRYNAIENIGWAGLTAPILLSMGYTKLRIASSDTWSSPYPSAAHPFIDNLIFFAGITLEHDQFDYTRLDKIDFIAREYQFVKEKPFLTVCQGQTAKNCCNCSKCLATILGFIAVGEDPEDYGFLVNKERALKRINQYIKHEKLDFPFIQRIKEIQERIKQHPFATKKWYAERVEKFLSATFDQNLASTPEIQYQQRLDWCLLHATFPSVLIPDICLRSANALTREEISRSPHSSLKHQGPLFSEENQSSHFIDKWNFVKLCDFAYDPETDPLMYPLTTKEGGAQFNPKKVRAGDSIFLRARHTHEFFKTIAPQITEPFIIIAHGEYKDAFDESYLTYFDNPHLIAWFGTHPCPILHPKFYAIPLGVWANHRTYQSERKLNARLAKLRKQKKSSLVYANFSEWTHPERSELVKLLKETGLASHTDAKLPFLDYLDEMGECAFSLSPRGLGIDCYRTWEALLVGSIPIVKRSYLDPIFQGLPVLIIDDWQELSREFLLKKHREIKDQDYDLSKLYIEYWKNVITQVRNEWRKGNEA